MKLVKVHNLFRHNYLYLLVILLFTASFYQLQEDHFRFEAKTILNSLVAVTNNQTLYFADDFRENEDVFDNWEDISSQGSMRTGGLPTNAPYTNYEADEDFITGIRNYDTSGEFVDNLELDLKFNEESGTTTYDSSSNGYTQASGSAAYKSTSYDDDDAGSCFDCKAGQDLTFDTILDAVPSTGTIVFWIKPDSTIDSSIATPPHLLCKVNNDVNRMYIYFTSGQGYIRVDYEYNSGGYTIGPHTTTTTWTADTWYHVAFTWDGTNWKWYVNGVLETTHPRTQKPMLNGSSRDLEIGHYYNENDFDGGIDDYQVYNSSLPPRAISELYHGSYRVISSPPPHLEQRSIDDYTDGFVVSWNLSSVRTNSPAEAIESASITLDYESISEWDTGASGDDICLSVINGYAYGGNINDSSGNDHATAVCNTTLRTINDIYLVSTADPTWDVTTLVDYWYLYSNDSILTFLFMPNPDNEVPHDEQIMFLEGTTNSNITIKTGDSVLRPVSYGSGNGGPARVHNFDYDIDDFSFIAYPWIEGSTSGMGTLQIYFYSGANATGTVVGYIYWADVWAATNGGRMHLIWKGANRYTSGTTEYNEWYTAGSDNVTIERNGTAIDFCINGDNKLSDSTVGGSITIRSMAIYFSHYGDYSDIPKAGWRSIIFQGHSNNCVDFPSTTPSSSSTSTIPSSTSTSPTLSTHPSSSIPAISSNTSTSLTLSTHPSSSTEALTLPQLSSFPNVFIILSMFGICVIYLRKFKKD